MYVCMCAGVTDEEIKHAAASGLGAHDIADALGVGSGCGTCMEFFYNLVAEQQVVAAPALATEVVFDSMRLSA